MTDGVASKLKRGGVVAAWEQLKISRARVGTCDGYVLGMREALGPSSRLSCRPRNLACFVPYPKPWGFWHYENGSRELTDLG